MSNDKAYRIAYLIAGYIRGTLTDKEKDELDDWLTERDENIELFGELTDEKNIEAALKDRSSYNSEAAIAKLKEKILHEKPTARRGKVWIMYAVAAAVSILLILFIVLNNNERPAPGMDIVARQDINPGTDKAILTIGSGKQIVLDSTVNEHIGVMNGNGLQVSDSGSMLHYAGTPAISEWHTLATPKGGQYRLQLADGTLVWLNAESSIHFPTAFTGKERKVEVTGEVYFEVAKNPSKQFIVTAGVAKTAVIGTHFNIEAYSQDTSLTITLAEGKISVTDTLNNKTLTLKPGDQAGRRSASFTIRNNADLEQVLAWKNGWFNFKEAPIQDIMQQVARWYNVEVEYKGNINYHFNADIERNVSVSKLLGLLEKTGRVHFDIKNNTIIVKP